MGHGAVKRKARDQRAVIGKMFPFSKPFLFEVSGHFLTKPLRQKNTWPSNRPFDISWTQKPPGVEKRKAFGISPESSPPAACPARSISRAPSSSGQRW